MKNYLSVFLVFCSIVILAQNKPSQKLVETSQNLKTTTTKKQPTYMVNGKLLDNKQTINLNLNAAMDIKVIKDDPKYPDGLIKITTK